MQEALSTAFLEVAVAIVSLVAAAVAAYVGAAAKKFLDSRQVHEYSSALAEFDPALHSALMDVALAAREKVMTSAISYGEGEQKAELRSFIHHYATVFEKKSGAKVTELLTPEHIESLIDVAVVESRKAWRKAHGVTIPPLNE